MPLPRPRIADARDELTELAAACAAGDHAAFEQLVRVTMTRLFRLAVRLMGDRQEAEDILQQSYLNVLGALRGGEFDREAAVQTWLYRITTNTALDALRRRRREQDRPRLQPEEREANQQASAELRELAEELEYLPHDQRLALVLKELEGLSTAEVAQVLGCSVGAVEQRLVRARATLRERCDRG